MVGFESHRQGLKRMRMNGVRRVAATGRHVFVLDATVPDAMFDVVQCGAQSLPGLIVQARCAGQLQVQLRQ